jgi:glycosyltransferase involved in cell wall biosynthesis
LEHQPLISIITPSLNQRRFIEATIDSVLSQDYPHIEYIVVDGGSTDGTLEVLAKYEGRLRWISEPDRGQSDAINKGFRLAKGEIVAWLNSDDTYMPGAVRAAVDHLVAHPDCAMVYGDGYLIDEEGRVTRRFPATEPFDLWKLVYVIDYILQQSAFFRREAVEGVGYLDEQLHWGMDWDLFIKIGKRFRVDYLPRPMANLREYGTAKTFSGGSQRLSELVSVMHRHGTRRYPPARVAYAIDTYFRLVFNVVDRVLPAEGWLRRARGFLERQAYNLADRICRNAKGLYADGWAAPRSHFLFRRTTPGHRLVVRGALPGIFRRRRPTRLHAVVNGVDLGPHEVPATEEFRATWRLPDSLSDPDVIEVELRCRPGFRPSPLPLWGDRRRLAFQLRAIELE